MENPVKVGITHGDINGVGYEVILKALQNNNITELFTPVIFGYTVLLEKARELLQFNDLSFHVVKSASAAVAGKINIVALPSPMPEHKPGVIDKAAGRSAAQALNMAVKALKDGAIDVLVTAPISKEAIHNEHFNFPGHTEFLRENLAKEDENVLMILFNEKLRVALLTVHLPISKVSENINVTGIVETVKLFAETLKKDFGCSRPSVAVLALNPHAGDGGVLGSEEKDVIAPAIDQLQKEGILAFGPFAADGFFGHATYENFDGVLAMYHDQGLAPFKTLATDSGVNFTAGLPFVRTSPDHGTAFDIAWKGEAEGESMRQAIYAAIDIFRRRKTFEEASANPLKKYMAEKPDRGERQNNFKKDNENPGKE